MTADCTECGFRQETVPVPCCLKCSMLVRVDDISVGGLSADQRNELQGAVVQLVNSYLSRAKGEDVTDDISLRFSQLELD